ncbi:hypothetical protein [Streptomyces sp. OspMP-M43]|uniref:hypothetical protein n=1 Tax=Streptomyces sp. OspMP-M43 TaxID=1839781 RepID=UPI00114D018F|nr:hypothetical protein [Streptomyces sp. OspMP-M43]
MTIDPAINPVVAALPGGGWLAEYRQDDGSVEASPLVAWLVLADGEMLPRDAWSEGYAHDPRDAGNFQRVYHPDAVASDRTG